MPNLTALMSCLTVTGPRRPQNPAPFVHVKNRSRLPNPYKSYSRTADQLFQNAHSRPMPAVQPVRVSEALYVHGAGASHCTVVAKGSNASYLSCAHAAPPLM